jgi:hypothetical protein
LNVSAMRSSVVGDLRLRSLLALGGGSRGLALGRLLALADADRRAAPVGTGVGRLEVDDVAEEDLPLVELVAPDDDRLERQRALAETRDHRLSPGLDALGDGDLALAGEEFHRPHLAQVHANGIVGPVGRLAGGGRPRHGRAGGLGDLVSVIAGGRGVGGGLLALGLLRVDHVDAHVAEHRHGVLDLLGGHLLRREDLVELVVGDVAALLGELDHPLDRGVRKIEQRAVRALRAGLLRLVVLARLRCHDRLRVVPSRRRRSADDPLSRTRDPTGPVSSRSL